MFLWFTLNDMSQIHKLLGDIGCHKGDDSVAMLMWQTTSAKQFWVRWHSWSSCMDLDSGRFCLSKLSSLHDSNGLLKWTTLKRCTRRSLACELVSKVSTRPMQRWGSLDLRLWNTASSIEEIMDTRTWRWIKQRNAHVYRAKGIQLNIVPDENGHAAVHHEPDYFLDW